MASKYKKLSAASIKHMGVKPLQKALHREQITLAQFQSRLREISSATHAEDVRKDKLWKMKGMSKS